MLHNLNIELKPLRKNARLAGIAVIELDTDGLVGKTTYYETVREAVYHACMKENGDILVRGGKYGRSRLLAFYCKYNNRMKFGFGAEKYEKSSMASDLWWANFA